MNVGDKWVLICDENLQISKYDSVIQYEIENYQKWPNFTIGTIDKIINNVIIIKWSNGTSTHHTRDIFLQLVNTIFVPQTTWIRDVKIKYLLGQK
jgi:hypothetical protein